MTDLESKFLKFQTTCTLRERPQLGEAETRNETTTTRIQY